MNTSIDTIDLFTNSSALSKKNKKKNKNKKTTGKTRETNAESVEWSNTVQDFERPDQVNWEVNDETDPGSFFTLASDEDVHAAMIGDAPLPQGLHVGDTPAKSAANLKAW